MKKVIYKYPLMVGFPTTVNFPVGGIVKFFALQMNEPTVWVECLKDAATVKRQVQCFGTGEDIPIDALHLGSVMQGAYVWHFYLMM